VSGPGIPAGGPAGQCLLRGAWSARWRAWARGWPLAGPPVPVVGGRLGGMTRSVSSD